MSFVAAVVVVSNRHRAWKFVGRILFILIQVFDLYFLLSTSERWQVKLTATGFEARTYGTRTNTARYLASALMILPICCTQ